MKNFLYAIASGKQDGKPVTTSGILLRSALLALIFAVTLLLITGVVYFIIQGLMQV